ncbi:hypothetical protein LTR17_022528 [Elasticomyces elasticus]|nr:hypothetical protein LTR17_022528 [Elasticomyces elasticus]
MDLEFTGSGEGRGGMVGGPIKTEQDLDVYGARVAGTVALLCIQLVLYHYPEGLKEEKAKRLMKAGHDMGIALQYTNITRDLEVDARNKRVYVPPGWLKKEKHTPKSFVSGVLKQGGAKDQDEFFMKKVNTIRGRLMDRAFEFYHRSRSAIEELPPEARGAMRVAVESYMQIGRELRRPGWKSKGGRATVPVGTRLWVGWRALLGPR